MGEIGEDGLTAEERVMAIYMYSMAVWRFGGMVNKTTPKAGARSITSINEQTAKRAQRTVCPSSWVFYLQPPYLLLLPASRTFVQNGTFTRLQATSTRSERIPGETKRPSSSEQVQARTSGRAALRFRHLTS